MPALDTILHNNQHYIVILKNNYALFLLENNQVIYKGSLNQQQIYSLNFLIENEQLYLCVATEKGLQQYSIENLKTPIHVFTETTAYLRVNITKAFSTDKTYVFENDKLLYTLPHQAKKIQILDDNDQLAIALHDKNNNQVYLYLNGSHIFTSPQSVQDFCLAGTTENFYFYFKTTSKQTVYYAKDGFSSQMLFTVKALATLNNKAVLWDSTDKILVHDGLLRDNTFRLTISYQQSNTLFLTSNESNEPPDFLAEYIDGGHYGNVFKTTYLCQNAAVKQFHNIPKGPTAEESLLKEATTLSKLQHPHIIDIWTTVNNQFSQTFSMTMPFATKGTFSDYLSSLPANTDWSSICNQYALQITGAIHYLHSYNIVHGDLKTDNILVDYAGQLKVGDFGSACDVQNNLYVEVREAGTADFAGPEVLRHPPKLYKQSDIYSLASVFIQIGTHEYPWPLEFSNEYIASKVLNHERPTIPNWFPTELTELIQQSFLEAPLQRPSTTQVQETLHTMQIRFNAERYPLRNRNQFLLNAPSSVTQPDQKKHFMFK